MSATSSTNTSAVAAVTSPSAFKASWISRSFSSSTTRACSDASRGEHAQMLFSAALPHVAPSSGPDVRRVAALYALYLLYHTQPLMPPACVYITPRQARHLADLAEAAKRVGAKDALEALRALADHGAFAIGAAESPREDELEETLQRAERGEIETATRESGERVRKKEGKIADGEEDRRQRQKELGQTNLERRDTATLCRTRGQTRTIRRRRRGAESRRLLAPLSSTSARRASRNRSRVSRKTPQRTGTRCAQ